MQATGSICNKKGMNQRIIFIQQEKLHPNNTISTV
jgi:hypothetical protein